MKIMIFIYKTKRRGNLNSLFATLNFDKNDPIYYMDIYNIMVLILLWIKPQ